MGGDLDPLPAQVPVPGLDVCGQLVRGLSKPGTFHPRSKCLGSRCSQSQGGNGVLLLWPVLAPGAQQVPPSRFCFPAGLEPGQTRQPDPGLEPAAVV